MPALTGLLQRGYIYTSCTDILAENDAIRIMVATDSHVGYMERDPIRKDDSWRSFDEMMTIAKKRDVDMVLLAGDLFHDNSKSNASIIFSIFEGTPKS